MPESIHHPRQQGIHAKQHCNAKHDRQRGEHQTCLATGQVAVG